MWSLDAILIVLLPSGELDIYLVLEIFKPTAAASNFSKSKVHAVYVIRISQYSVRFDPSSGPVLTRWAHLTTFYNPKSKRRDDSPKSSSTWYSKLRMYVGEKLQSPSLMYSVWHDFIQLMIPDGWAGMLGFVFFSVKCWQKKYQSPVDDILEIPLTKKIFITSYCMPRCRHSPVNSSSNHSEWPALDGCTL